MTVNISKPAVNVREKLAELDKPTGIAGEAMLRAETPQEQFNLIGAGRRNMIINGAMQIAQRGTSATGVASTGYYATDRMAFYEANSGTYTVRQDNNSGLAEFPHYHHVIATTADTSLGSTELVSGLLYKIEGNDLQHLGYGTSSAKHTTLSFWVRTNVAGDYTVSIYKTFGSARVVAPIYTIEQAGVWQYVTLVIPPDTNTGILNSNGDGLAFYFNLSSGSSYTVTEAPNWSSYTTGNWSGGQTAHWGKTTNDYWHITGVQLEVGKVATPFEHRSYGEELALCQRYAIVYGGAETRHLGTGSMYNASSVNFSMHTPVHMRAQPALIKTTNGSGNWLQVYVGATGNNSNPTPQLGEGGDTNTFRVYAPNVGLNQTVGLGAWVQVLDGASLLLDAEL
jgi:hypothetical protein